MESEREARHCTIKGKTGDDPEVVLQSNQFESGGIEIIKKAEGGKKKIKMRNLR